MGDLCLTSSKTVDRQTDRHTRKYKVGTRSLSVSLHVISAGNYLNPYLYRSASPKTPSHSFPHLHDFSPKLKA